MNYLNKLLLIVAVAGAAAGCASAQAKSPVEHPNLDVPPVPPRVVEALPVTAPPPNPVEDLPPVAALPPRPRTAPTPAREANRADPKAADNAAVEAPAPPPAPVAAPTPPLRTPGSVEGAEAARQVNDVVGRAKGTLGGIDYRRLSAERRSQYDSARLMITQAEDAVKAANFEFARNLAEKADRLANELKGR